MGKGQRFKEGEREGIEEAAGGNLRSLRLDSELGGHLMSSARTHPVDGARPTVLGRRSEN